jgi:diadenosine tetraphosphatase ApaH/serine/threonine PP2A family protein phosphatase
MEIIILPTPEEASAVAARLVARQICEKPSSVLGLATGGTPCGLYRELARMHSEEALDFARVTTFNLDEYIGLDEDPEGFNDAAAEAVAWSRSQLTADDRKWLRELKYFRLVANFSIVHATLDGPQRWGYVFEKLEAAASFTYQNTQLCFFGHTHVPVAFIRDTGVRGGQYSKLKIEPGRKYFINVGSVGQPRDGDPRAAYVVYDFPTQTVELRRLEYDIPTTQKKILDAGLPPRLAHRLASGR